VNRVKLMSNGDLFVELACNCQVVVPTILLDQQQHNYLQLFSNDFQCDFPIGEQEVVSQIIKWLTQDWQNYYQCEPEILS
jgi:hypothetical protein